MAIRKNLILFNLHKLLMHDKNFKELFRNGLGKVSVRTKNS